MRIGVPKEIKDHEYRVGMVPAKVRECTQRGHEVFVQTGAGAAIGLFDEDYQRAGAKVVPDAAAVFGESELVVKVKEPQPSETAMLREGQTLFTYLHLAADPEQTRALEQSGCTAIAYETVTDHAGRLPLLTPMSEVAGRLSVQAGSHALELNQGGRGVLLGGVAGVEPANVVIIGGGVVGTNALRVALGMGADVTILDTRLERLKELDERYGPALTTLFPTTEAMEKAIQRADLVIGAVLIPGAAAPKLVTRDMVATMKHGSVLVDVAIDQGGCFETSRPTTHSEPTYVIDGVVHYCVTNMPGAVSRTSTFALNNATLPFTIALVEKGVRKALEDDPNLRNGLNIAAGKIVHPAVAEAVGQQAVAFEDVVDALP